MVASPRKIEISESAVSESAKKRESEKAKKRKGEKARKRKGEKAKRRKITYVAKGAQTSGHSQAAPE